MKKFKLKPALIAVFLLLTGISHNVQAAQYSIGYTTGSNSALAENIAVNVVYDDVLDEIQVWFNTSTYWCGTSKISSRYTVYFEGSQVAYGNEQVSGGNKNLRFALKKNPEPNKEYSVRVVLERLCGIEAKRTLFDKTVSADIHALANLNTTFSTTNSSLNVTWSKGRITPSNYTVSLQGKSILNPGTGFQTIETKTLSKSTTSTTFSSLYPGITYKTTVTQNTASGTSTVLSDETAPALTSISKISSAIATPQSSSVRVSWTNATPGIGYSSYIAVDRRRLDIGTSTQTEAYKRIASVGANTSTIPSSYVDNTEVSCDDHEYKLNLVFKKGSFEQIIQTTTSNKAPFPKALTSSPSAPSTFIISSLNTPTNCTSDIELEWREDDNRHPCQTYWFEVDRYQLDVNGNKISSSKTTVVDRDGTGVTVSQISTGTGPFASFFTTNQYKFKDEGSKVAGANYQYEVRTGTEWPNGQDYFSTFVTRTIGIGGTIDQSTSTVSATIDPTSSLTLTWDDLSNEGGYLIKRKINGVLDEEIEVGQNVTSFTDGVSGSAASCVDYSYEVLGVNACVTDGVSLGEVSTGTNTSGGGTVNLTFSADFSKTYAKKALLAHKGYERDFISLQWTVAQNAANLSSQKLYRKKAYTVGDSVLIATLDPGTRNYTDNQADANVLYSYYLTGLAECGAIGAVSNTIEGIGFRTPWGLVNGRVDFVGGVDVEGAQIAAENPSALGLNKSAYFDGDRDVALILDNDVDSVTKANNADANLVELDFITGAHSRTFEFWTKAESYNSGYIFSSGNFGSDSTTFLGFQTPSSSTSNVWELRFDSLVSVQVDLAGMVNPKEWHHFAITYDGSTVRLYVDGDSLNAVGQPLVWERNLNTADKAHGRLLVLGGVISGTSSTENYHGYLDEFRVWDGARSQDQIQKNRTGFLFGNESGLQVYLRMDENDGDFFYDASYEDGTQYHRRHALIPRNYEQNDLTFSTTIPTSDQLGYNGITDARGNYTIPYIRYRGTGELFNLVPFIFQHEFRPSNRNLFIGQSVPVHNEQDFEDISAFKVTGTVFYGREENGETVTYCPAAGLFMAIDGTIALRNGLPVTTNADGEFELTVPIGEHFISIGTTGHSFITGRFPEEGTHDFQEELSGIEFVDNTQTVIVGKVVGGTKEGNKKSGFGNTKNNIGVATIIFDAGCFVDTVMTNSETGEYLANVFPLEYVVKGGANSLDQEQFIASNPEIKFATTTEDLRLLRPLLTETDTVFDSDNNVIEVKELEYSIRKDYVYRVPHSLSVLEAEGSQEFNQGESVITALTDGIQDSIPVDQFDFPVFLQGSGYQARIKLTEVYSNRDNPSSILYDTVGVTDAEISIANGIADANTSFQLTQPSGDSLYTFYGGQPNILIDSDNPNSAFLKRMEITSSIGSTSNTWILDGYVLGSKPDGTSFVTNGPEIVEHILRDPPGSSSFATISKESAFESSFSFDVGASAGIHTNFILGAGASFATGVGVAVQTSVKASTQIEFDAEVILSGGQDYSETVTFAEDLNTSDDPLFVGADADLFIGKSYNMNFGLADYVEPILAEDCGGGIDCNGLSATATSGKVYQLARRGNFTVSPDGYDTYFIYTQRHIQEQLIPDLTRLRNDLIRSSPSYQSHLSPEDPNYGKNNDDPVFGSDVSTDTPLKRENADFDGPSYTFTKTFAPDEVVVDSVRSYNEQIRIWQETMALNEEMKVNAVNGQSLPSAGSIGEAIKEGVGYSGVLLDQKTGTLESNVSFSAGSAFTRNVTLENQMLTRFSWEVNLSSTVSIISEAKVSNTGVETENSITMGVTTSGTTARGKTHSISYEFTLQDDDPGNFYSVDIFDGGNQNGPIFKTQGGTSSCPYEEAEVTQFFEPGTIISPATVQQERPFLAVTPATQIGIPSDEAAVYTLTLGNENQTFEEDQEFILYLDPSTNPNGALVTIDGQDVNRGYLLGPEAIINRQLVIRKSPQQNEYQNIRLVLESACDDGINAEVFLSASFVPTCSNSAIITPLNQWTVNNSFENTLPITIGSYDLNFSGLEKIIFRYKPSTSAQWIERQAFFNKETAGGDTLLISRTSTNTIFDWDISSLSDGSYDLQTVTVCSNGVVKESEIITGKIDRVNPQVFGRPSPADGVLSPNDEISIRFNETIDAERIVKNLNFDIRGVLNGIPVRHFTSVGFDGDDNITIPNLNLGNSFTFEFWFNRDAIGAEELLLTYSAISVGINAANQIYVTDGTETATGATSIPAGSWAHIAMAYDKAAQQVNVYYNGNTDVAASLNPTLTNSGVTVGSTFKGKIHELRIWSDARQLTEVRLDYLNTLSGNEIDLAGYWPLDEGTGLVSDDKTGRRPAVINAAWSFAQEARGVALDGVDDHFEIDGSTVGFGPEEDFTLSFWYKADNSASVTLFSTGKVDGTEFDPQAWAVSSDESGILRLQSNGKTYPVEGDYLDGNWHHLALSVNRIGFANLYLDGETVISVSAQNFSSFAGNKIYFGTYGRFEGVVEMMDNYMQGSVDEIRLWNVARQEDQITRDMRYRQNGTEYGLFAYFPFEEYTEDQFGLFRLTETLGDQSDKTVSGLDLVEASLVGGAAYTNATPAINIARPVQAVNFSYVINDDEIIITPTDDAGRIENTLLDITVGGLNDLNGNTMASPVTWTAYIDKNQVHWLNAGYQATISPDAFYEFEATIVNDGGEQTDFFIKDLPIWLSTSTSTGSVDPLSTKTIKFKVAAGLGIGNYQENILLSTDFGFDEVFQLELDVEANGPEWDVNPENFEYSMSIIGQVIVKGIVSSDPNDLVAAIISGDVRGVTSVSDLSNGRSLAFLTIYSDSLAAADVEFRIWDADKGVVFSAEASPQVSFVNEGVVGSLTTPVIISAQEDVSYTYNLKKGWNWVAFPMTFPDNSVEVVLDRLNASTGDVLKGFESFAQYDAEFGWNGSLVQTDGKAAYKIHLEEAASFDVLGTPILLSESIPLFEGWNWISYLPTVTQTVNNALSGYPAQDGDLIKNQSAFAIYDGGTNRWIGTLTMMEAGKGYQLKITGSSELFYNNSYDRSARVNQVNQESVATSAYFASNMSLVVTSNMANKGYELLIYSNGVLRGRTHAVEGKYFLTAFGDETTDTLDFKFEKEGVSIPTSSQVLYTSDAVQYLNLDADVLSDSERLIAYPIPMRDILNVSYTSTTSGRLEISLYNSAGLKVETIFEGNVGEGVHAIRHQSQLTQGVYFLISDFEGILNSMKVVK